MRSHSFFISTAALLTSLTAAAQLPGMPEPPDPLHLSAQFLKVDAPRLPALSAQVKAPDIDLPIALWIASRARISPEVVIQSRIGGLDWLSIFTKYRVPVQTLIIPVQSKCPPYGKAWGYRRNQRGATAVRFTDIELAEFVHVRAINGMYGTPFTEIVSNRCAGKGMGHIIGYAHDKKHKKSKGHKRDNGHGDGNGHGHDDQGKGKSKGKGKGHSSR